MKISYDFSTGKRGPVDRPSPGHTEITLLLDDQVIDWFRQQVNAAGRGDYQELINAVLREHINRSSSDPLEETLRRVIREELSAAS